MTTTVTFESSLEDYHKLRWHHLSKCLKHLEDKSDEEAVHRARVEIKKMVALYEFIAYCDHKLDCKVELHKLIRIFKLLGKRRDYGNALSLCLRFKIDIAVLDHEEEKMKAINKKIADRIEKGKDIFDRIKDDTIKRLHHADMDKWEKYLHEKHMEINRTLAAGPDEEELHHSRRTIKYLLYNTGIGEEQVMISSADKQSLDTLQDQIGLWHDVLLFRTELQKLDFDRAEPVLYATVEAEEKRLREQIPH